MLMKKRYIIPVLLILVAACIWFWRPEWQIPRSISRELDLNVRGSRLLSHTDTHGGFHGDGETLTVLELTENQARAVEETLPLRTDWHPMTTQELNERALFMLLETQSELPCPLPDPEVCWYWVYDRHREATDTGDVSSIFGRNSLNFDFALYDPANGWLWFFALDT